MVKRAVTLATAVGGLMLTAFPVLPVPAQAQLSPTAEPSAMARSDIPPKYLSYYTGAAKTCPGLPWQVLAAIGSIESDHGRSSAPDVHGPTGYGGPEGPMQFEAPTFAAYAVRADDEGPASPYDPKDAIYSAARMLCADGGGSPNGLYQAIFTYNHAGWYVNDVLSLALRYSGPPAKPAVHPAPHPHPSARPGPAPAPGAHATCSPDRIRTGVTALRGRRPRPLDDGAVPCPSATAPRSKPAIPSGVQTTASPPARPTGTPTAPNPSPPPSPTATPSTSPTAIPGSPPPVTPGSPPAVTPTAAPSVSPSVSPTASPSQAGGNAPEPSLGPTTSEQPSPAPSPSDQPTPPASTPAGDPSLTRATTGQLPIKPLNPFYHNGIGSPPTPTRLSHNGPTQASACPPTWMPQPAPARRKAR